jgi:hypothetical protein
MGDQVGNVVITGLGERHVGAHPPGFSRVGEEGVRIRRSADPCSRRRSIGEVAPTQCSFLPRNMLDPDTPQGVKRRNLTQPGRSSLRGKRTQHGGSIVSHEDGRRLTSGLAIGETSVFHTVLVPLDPHLLPRLLEPLKSHHCQTLQHCPNGFSDPFHPIA